MPASLKEKSRLEWQVGTRLRLKAPIVQAPLGSCDGPLLAAAVSRAGGLGCLTVNATPEPMLARRLQQIRRRTPRPVLIAFTCQWQRDSVLELCLKHRYHHFQVFWWNGPRLSRQIKAADGVVYWQVGSVSQAEEALEHGADILIAQGTAAGGQVRSPFPLPELIGQLRALTGDSVPLIAGGGLADANDVRQVLSWGAAAAYLGTRFLLSDEARADNRCKSRLVRSTDRSLFLDPRILGDWPCVPRRRLLTARGEDRPDLFAGSGLSRMTSLLPAAEIVRRLHPDRAVS